MYYKVYVLIVLMANINVAYSQQYTTENGYVEFVSEAPLTSFTGTSENLNGLIDLEKNLLDFYVDLKSIDTGIGLRNKHMRESYLETDKYPYAEFTGKLKNHDKIDINSTEPQSVIAEGVLKIHGESKPVTVEGTLVFQSTSNVKLEASFVAALTDFNITKPKVVFYELADEQKITIKANFDKTNL